jgi:hypothetical protein
VYADIDVCCFFTETKTGFILVKRVEREAPMFKWFEKIIDQRNTSWSSTTLIDQFNRSSRQHPKLATLFLASRDPIDLPQKIYSLQ